QEPKTVIHATGMIYDKKKETVELKQRVKAHYERPGMNATSTPNNLNRRPSNAMRLEADLDAASNQPERRVKPIGAVQPEVQLNLSRDIDRSGDHMDEYATPSLYCSKILLMMLLETISFHSHAERADKDKQSGRASCSGRD